MKPINSNINTNDNDFVDTNKELSYTDTNKNNMEDNDYED